MHPDDEQTLARAGPHYANEPLCFKGGGWGGGVGEEQQEQQERAGLFAGGGEQPGSHMLLIIRLMDRQHSGPESFHTNHYSLANES